MDSSLYLGFDLSTQQLKGVAIDSNLDTAYAAKVDFDADLAKYGIQKGVQKHENAGEVFAPVAMWAEAFDLVLDRLHEQGLNFGRVRAISGAGQQHGSVYWSWKAEELLKNADAQTPLHEQLEPEAFSHANSPNWQDASTQDQCDRFEQCLGNAAELARVTGSRAHHRFTGPQILRFREKYPEDYENTARISLVSSFLASLFLGRVAPLDIGDVTGMNLWDMNKQEWSPELIELAAGNGPKDVADLTSKLGEVARDGAQILGPVSKWLVDRYGFDPNCQILPFTGDNPSTILALPLKPEDAIVSLGTSTTFLTSTSLYVPDPAYHLMNHPTTPGLRMFMLCYKNGGLARERVRNEINELPGVDLPPNAWEEFNKEVERAPPMLKRHAGDDVNMGLYFPLAEIVPNVHPGLWRFKYNQALSESHPDRLWETKHGWKLPQDDARAIVESQIFSLRLRSKNIVTSEGDIPPQPRRIYLVGGGAKNDTIAKVIGELLGGTHGVYRLNIGENGCAVGSANKAVWAMERAPGERFEDLIGKRWNLDHFAKKVDQGYRPELWKEYGDALPGFKEMEERIIAREGRA